MSTSTTVAPRWWTTQETAEFLGVAVTTLYNWSVQGKGPRRYRVGRGNQYRPEDVEAFRESCIVQD